MNALVRADEKLGSNQLSFVPGYPPGGEQQEFGIVLHSRAPLVAEEDDLALGAGRLGNRVRFRRTATIAGFWRAMAATLMTQTRHWPH
jgi:hypothetical protein